jgi:hypothetical protein
VHVYNCCAVFCVVLAVMCICVIYKFLSLGLRSATRSGQAKLKIAKPSRWRGKQSKRPKSRGEQEDSVCFERGARMDSFAPVLTMPSHSSMYV